MNDRRSPDCAPLTTEWVPKLSAVAGHDQSDDVDPAATASLQAWVQSQIWASMPTGHVLHLDGAVVAHSLLSDAAEVRESPPLAPNPADDALVLAVVRVHPEHRGRGLGSLLVRRALEAMHTGPWKALAAWGHRGSRHGRAGDVTGIPAEWLAHVGFRVRTDHPVHPLMVIEDSATVSVRGIIDALARRVPLLKPAVLRPEPAPQTSSSTQTTSMSVPADDR